MSSDLVNIAIICLALFYGAFTVGQMPGFISDYRTGAVGCIGLIRFPIIPTYYIIVVLLYGLRIVLFTFSTVTMLITGLIRRFVMSEWVWTDQYGKDDFRGWFWAVYSLEYKAGMSAEMSADKKKHADIMKQNGQTIGQNNQQINELKQLVEMQLDRIRDYEDIIIKASERGKAPDVYMRSKQLYYNVWDQDVAMKDVKTKGQQQKKGGGQPNNGAHNNGSKGEYSQDMNPGRSDKKERRSEEQQPRRDNNNGQRKGDRRDERHNDSRATKEVEAVIANVNPFGGTNGTGKRQGPLTFNS